MAHRSSPEDRAFCAQFESGEFPPAELDHRAHLRLSYVYLIEHDTETAYQLMREALLAFLEHNGVDPSKYHDTMTRAWILAVRHFMEATSSQDSAESFIEQNPEMLDSKIMMTHYSADVLVSDEARAQFVDPDLDPIPQHAG
ncbi:MAG: hypothetical protein IH855_11070 [Bacteroidetes bacterium]|nr:hypothetical protein [Bacteroidota bacterium]